jgi:hypothetical protein
MRRQAGADADWHQDPDSFFQTRSSPGCPFGSFPVTGT